MRSLSEEEYIFCLGIMWTSNAVNMYYSQKHIKVCFTRNFAQIY